MLSSIAVNDGDWHSVTITRVNQDWTMALNERTSGPVSRVSLQATGATSTLSMPGELYAVHTKACLLVCVWGGGGGGGGAVHLNGCLGMGDMYFAVDVAFAGIPCGLFQ
jgi:hypothetical protein